MMRSMSITFSVPKKYREAKPDLIERVDRIAKIKERSRSEIIVKAVLEYLERNEAK